MENQMSDRVRFLEESRARWKKQAQELKRALAAEKAARQKLVREARPRQKTAAAIALSPSAFVARDQRVPHHRYLLRWIVLFLSFVLSAASSLRGASQTFALLQAWWPSVFACPPRSTGRLWLLRVGYFKLTRPKEPAADWVWIVDHTLQLGTAKCLLILGVRLSGLPAEGECLRHTQVEPLALVPVTH